MEVMKITSNILMKDYVDDWKPSAMGYVTDALDAKAPRCSAPTSTLALSSAPHVRDPPAPCLPRPVAAADPTLVPGPAPSSIRGRAISSSTIFDPGGNGSGRGNSCSGRENNGCRIPHLHPKAKAG